jgi:hypothetical protein
MHHRMLVPNHGNRCADQWLPGLFIDNLTVIQVCGGQWTIESN